MEIIMYKPPIALIMSKTKTSFEDMIYAHAQEIGIIVDKDELIKALQYDREQYEKGWEDGYNEKLREFAEEIKLAFYNEFDEIIPSIMSDKIDEIFKRMVGESNGTTDN